MGRERTGQSSRKRAGRGSHGSTTKAGKMRMQQPKHWDLSKNLNEKGQAQKHYKKHKSPRMAKRRSYEKRVLLKRKSGQNWIE